MFVDDYLKKWLETAARPRLRDNTYREYEGLLSRYVSPSLGSKRLCDVRPLDIQLLYTSISEQGLSPRTVRFTFATKEGQPLIRLIVVQKHFKPILKRAKLPETLRMYDLRHTCATLLLSANENPKVVSERLGHSSITLTMDIYSHVLPDMQQAATEKLEHILFNKAVTQ